MKLLSMDKALLRRKILRLNILTGTLIFVVAVFLILTGDYGNLAERREAESVFNMIALTGLCYAAFSWIFCVMSKPFWFPLSKNNEG